MPEGEEEEQEIFEQIMKEYFPNLTKTLDMPSSGCSEGPKEVGSKKKHTKTHHN